MKPVGYNKIRKPVGYNKIRSRYEQADKKRVNKPTDNLKTFKSPRLKEFPDRVIFITDKNYADIGNKMTNCLKEGGINARFINAPHWTMDDPYIQECFNLDHSKILAIFYDPGNTMGETRYFNKSVGIPTDVPWGLLRGSSYYRIKNLELEAQAIGMMRIGKKKIWNPNSPKSSKFTKMKRANKYFDSLTPLVMCGTECLLPINPKSVFLGQPQPFTMRFNTKKEPNMIGHITAASTYRSVKKGTGRITSAFNKIDFMETQIIGCPRVPKSKCESLLKNAGMIVITMTTWDSGLGYVGLESLESSCLTMSSLPKSSQLINSPIVHVGKPKDLVEKARFYHDEIDEFHRVRKIQHDWGKKHFSYKAIAARFREIVQNAIDNKWEKVDEKFRGFENEESG